MGRGVPLRYDHLKGCEFWILGSKFGVDFHSELRTQNGELRFLDLTYGKETHSSAEIQKKDSGN